MRRMHNVFVSRRPARSIDRPHALVKPVTRCVTTKAMIFSCRKADRLVPYAPEHAWQPALSAGRARVTETSEKAQAAERMPEPDRDKTDFA
jgi:hypothetical protein